jgi:flagellin
MIINHNLAANNAIRNTNINQTNASKSMQKLSSGLRINSAADDAAGLAISEKMRGQIRGLDQSTNNAQDAVSMTQTAEGALNETQSILQRMKELATQASNDTNVTIDRGAIQSEMTQLTSEVNRIGNTTEFNTQKLLKGGEGTKYEAKASATVDISLVSLAASADISIKFDGGAEKTVHLASAATAGDIVAAINATAAGTASLVNGKLVISSTNTTSASGSVEITQIDAGLATAVGISTQKVEGAKVSTSGEVLGTVDLTGSALAASSTINFKADNVQVSVHLASAATLGDITAALNAVTGLSAKSVGGKLVISSQTSGKNSTIELTGGTAAALTQLGLTQGAKGTGSDKDFNATMQIGANQGQNLTITISDMRARALAISGNASDTKSWTDSTTGQSFTAKFTATNAVTDGTTTTAVESGLDISTKDNATAAIKVLDDAINSVSSQRSLLGAAQNRLEHTINNLGTASENLTTAESRIRDVDMAKEMSTFSKNNILSQAAQAMLAQANQQPSQVLQLLR